MNPLYKSGDLVVCSSSEELEQPLIIKGLDAWHSKYNPIVLYEVSGKHKKKGNVLTVRLMESQLAPYTGQEIVDVKDEDSHNSQG